MTKKLSDVPGFEIESPLMIDVYEKVRDFARLGEPCIFLGPTGSGKEFLAKYYIQEWKKIKPGAGNKLVNCSCLYGEVAYSELFGHTRGAFTSADRDHVGFFESLNKSEGVLFLDEFGDLPENIQAMLLRAIDTREGRKARKLGSSTEYPTDKVKVIAATESAPEKIRPSLLNRMGFILHIPSLDERAEDVKNAIPYLIKQALFARIDREALFVNLFGFKPNNPERSDQNRKPRNSDSLARESFTHFIDELSSDILEEVLQRSWPGNFRSLNQALLYGLVRCQNQQTEQQLKNNFIKYFREGIPDFSIAHSQNNKRPERPNQKPFETAHDPVLLIFKNQLDELFPKVDEERKSHIAKFFTHSIEKEFSVKDYMTAIGIDVNRTAENHLSKMVNCQLLDLVSTSYKYIYKVSDKIRDSIPIIKTESRFLGLPVGIDAIVGYENEKETALKSLLSNPGVFISGLPRAGKTTFAVNIGRELVELGHVVLYYNLTEKDGLEQLAGLLTEQLKMRSVEIGDDPEVADELKPIAQIARIAGYMPQLFPSGNKAVLIIDQINKINTEQMKQKLFLILALWQTSFRFVLVGQKMANHQILSRFVEVRIGK